MKCEKLAGLQPEGVFACFEKLCSIPHGSGNIEAISNYLKEFAESHGVRVIQDPVGDILWFQPATPGYEDHPGVIVQACCSRATWTWSARRTRTAPWIWPRTPWT